MSGHLIGCVKRITDLPTSHKLALVAFADSGDDRTHIALPGYEGVQEWAGCSRGRAAELIRDLVTWGYLRQHKRGHRGQRAEWIVFPDGCCELHRTPVPETPPDVAAIAAAAGVSVDQARLMLSAIGTSTPPADPDPSSTQIGSDAPDTVGGNESDTPDPLPTDSSTAVENQPAEPGKGPERVHGSRSTANAFTPSETPQPPRASPQGSCSAHPNGHANCRACGTTQRQRDAVAKRAAAEAQRRANAAAVRAARAEADQAATPQAREAAAAKARAALAARGMMTR